MLKNPTLHQKKSPLQVYWFHKYIPTSTFIPASTFSDFAIFACHFSNNLKNFALLKIKSPLHGCWFHKYFPTSTFIPASTFSDLATFASPPRLFQPPRLFERWEYCLLQWGWGGVRWGGGVCRFFSPLQRSLQKFPCGYIPAYLILLM